MDRDDEGQFTPTVSDEEVVEAIAQLPEPVLTADVAEQWGITRSGADYRLRRLRDDGRVTSQRAGGVLFWSTVDDDGSGDTPETAETAETGDIDTRGGRSDPSDPQGSDAKTGEDEPPTADTDDELVEAVRGHLEGHPPNTSHGRRGVMVVYRALRGGPSSTAKTAALKTEVYDAIGEHYGSERAAWESIARYLEELPGLEKAGYGEWRYAGDEAVRDDLE